MLPNDQLNIEFRRGRESSAQNSGVLFSFSTRDAESAAEWSIHAAPRNEKQFQVDHLTVELYHTLWPLLCRYYADPLASLTCSKTMLLPHQVEAATRVLDAIRPRFLIADEVGLGKTIEAGLIIKEVLLKHSFERVLICTPATLLHQWRAELSSKFNEQFFILTGDILRRNPRILQTQKKVLVSVDLAKDERYLSAFLEFGWDMAVFDEAHRLRRDRNKITRSYHFAEKISMRCKSLLLLSATPFRGKIDEIYYLIQLIDPDILGPIHPFLMKYESGSLNLQKKLQPVVIRRRKVDVGGFTQRFAKTVKIELSPAERNFYNEVTEYVRREYNRALDSGQRMRGFVMITFQKLLDSSPEALLRALQRRKEKLESMVYRAAFANRNAGDALLEMIGETEEDYGDWEEDLEDTSEPGFDPQEVRFEILSLQKLIEAGRRLQYDSKFEMLCKTLLSMQKKGHKKFLIFTQFKSTLDFLSARLLEKGFRVQDFHGSMSMQEKETAVENFFKECDIFILTEAGGEGRNLQIATALFNYDLPWSPVKIEQRIGRIHRFGQEKDVHIVNFACKDTVAERVLEVLENKIRIFEDALGESDTLLGILEDDFSFSESFMKFLSRKKSRKEWESELQKGIEMARNSMQRLNHLISPEFLDFDMSRFTETQSNTGKFSENTLIQIVQKFLQMKNLPELWSSARYEKNILYWNNRRGSFFQNLAGNGIEYLAIGHEMVDSMISTLLQRCEGSAVFRLASKKPGWLIHCSASIKLDRVYRRNYSVCLSDDLQTTKLNDLFPGVQILDATDDLASLKAVLQAGIEHIKPQIDADLKSIHARLLPGAEILRQNITNSHRERTEELQEKLEIQKGKSRWYDAQKMAPAITRTIHRRQSEDARAQRRLQELNSSLATQITLEIRHVVRYTGYEKILQH